MVVIVVITVVVIVVEIMVGLVVGPERMLFAFTATDLVTSKGTVEKRKMTYRKQTRVSKRPIHRVQTQYSASLAGVTAIRVMCVLITSPKAKKLGTVDARGLSLKEAMGAPSRQLGVVLFDLVWYKSSFRWAER